MEKRTSLLREYLNEHNLIFSTYVVIGIVRNFSAFLLSISIGQFFALHYHSGSSKGKLLSLLGIHIESIHAFFIFFFSLLLVRGIFEYLDRTIATRQGEGFARFIRERLFEKQMTEHGELFKKNYYGKYLLRYSNDMKALHHYLSKGIMGGVRDLGFLIMGVLMIGIIDWKVAILSGSFMIIVIVIISLVSAKQRRFIITSRKERSNLLSFVTKSFQRYSKITAAGEEQKAIGRFNDSSDKLFESNMQNNRFESLLQALLSVTQFLLIGIFLSIMATTHWIKLHSGDALVLILIMMLMNSALKRLLQVPSVMNKGKISLDKIDSLLRLGINKNDV